MLAEGEAPTPGYDVSIELSPPDVHPPQFDLLWAELPGTHAEVITPYRCRATVRYPAEKAEIVVHHAEGQDRIAIEPAPAELGRWAELQADTDTDAGGDEATGYSSAMSLDEAFRKAVAALGPFQPPHPDAMARIDVIEIGALHGGFAGFHDAFVRVRRSV